MTDRQIYARIWRDYLWPRRGLLIAAAIFMVALALASAAYAFIVKRVVDAVSALDGTDAVGNALGFGAQLIPILLLVTVVSGGSMYAQRVLSNRIALGAVADLQKRMLRAAHTDDYAALTAAPIGGLISRFTSDVTVVTNALIRVVTNLVKDALTIAALIASMLWFDWQLTLLILLVYPLAFWPVIAISKRLRGRADAVQDQVGVITSELKESFGAGRLVRTYGLEDREAARLDASFDERIRRTLRVVSDQARVDPILEVVGGLAVAGIFVFGVYRVTGGASTPGDIAAVLTSLLILAPRARALGTLNTVIQEGLASLARMFAVIDSRATIVDTPGAVALGRAEGRIEYRGVGFTYPDGTRALDGLSFAVAPGESVLLAGPSGVGKSTALDLLPRLYDVTEGAVLVDGHDVRDLTLASLRANIAVVSQSVDLFGDTVAANIAMGRPEASRAEIEAAARAADAHDFIAALPRGYDTVLGEDGDTLSGGQRQRLSIARALLRDAPILLLDEATSALDAASEAKVQAALDRLRAGRTTLMVSHKPVPADRVIEVRGRPDISVEAV